MQKDPLTNMTDQVNKDLLIAIMERRQHELEKMVKVQADQMKNYQEYIDISKALMIKYEQEATANTKKMAELTKMLDARQDENTRLSNELQTLTQIEHLHHVKPLLAGVSDFLSGDLCTTDFSDLSFTKGRAGSFRTSYNCFSFGPGTEHFRTVISLPAAL